MSRYEFLRNVTIGQYIPTGSVLHRLDPRVRLVGAILLVGAVTLTASLPGLGIAITAALLGMVLGRIPAHYAVRGLLPPLPFLLILAALQVFFNAGTDSAPLLTLWGLVISGNDFLLGVTLILRFLALILVLSLTTFITSTSELTNGLQALLAPLGKLGLPVHDFVLVVQVTLRFIPLLAQSAERIAKAQAARGVEWGAGKGGLIQRARQILPLLVPLFLTSLRRAESLALAMDARGYGEHIHRTSLVTFHFRWGDALAVVIAAALAAAIVLLPGVR